MRKVVLDPTLENGDELEDFLNTLSLTSRRDDMGRKIRPDVNTLSLASWSAGIGGIEWLDELCADRKAMRSGDGYPVRYRSTAGVILPIIAAGIPFGKSPQVIGDDYFLPRNWGGDVKINTGKVKECKSNDILLIDAWDQS